jgi:hypothetical protein
MATSIGMPGGSAREGVCIAAGVAAVGDVSREMRTAHATVIHHRHPIQA